MPWDRSAPTAAKYRTAEHRETNKKLRAQLARDGQGVCAETICVKPSRLITPTMSLHLCHDITGTYYLGLGHAACNLKAAAREARRRQLQRRTHSRVW